LVNRKGYLVAITGTAGSGKTTVLNFLKEYHYYVFDADDFSRNVIKSNNEVIKYLENIIGEKLLNNDIFDFKKVGQFFDNNPLLESKFEVWYQRIMAKKIIEEIEKLEKEDIYFFDIPFLDKKGISDYFNEIWLIKTDYKICFDRIKNRNNYSDNKIRYLIERSEVNLSALSSKHIIINNNQSIDDIKKKIFFEIQRLEKMFG